MTGRPPAPNAGALDARRLAELTDLVRSSQRLAATFGAAAPKLTNVGRRQTLLRFRDEQRALADALVQAIREGGGTPPSTTATPGDAADWLAGGERRMVAGICRLARHARARYLRLADRRDGFPEALRERLLTAAEDVARHCEWAETQLAGMPAASRGEALRERVAGRVAELGAIAAERRPSSRTLAVGAIALGVGFVVGAAMGRRR